MPIVRLILVVYIISFFTACGSSESQKESTVVEAITHTLEVDAGSDKWAKVNDSIIIDGADISSDVNVSFYTWEYEGDVLATTKVFSYTPTVLGVNTLDFSVHYNDGTVISDTVNIIVTSLEINLDIPTLSETVKKEYLEAINEARSTAQDCGTKGNFPATTALTWNDKLYNASYEHSQDLIASKTFSHDGSGTESDWSGYRLGKKSSIEDRTEAYGYEWNNLGENLAGGTSMNTATEAVTAWLESDGHCENLMNPNFKEVGMALVKEENSVYTHYWSQSFGTPK